MTDTIAGLGVVTATDFGVAFRRERKAMGYTQAYVAEKAGVSRLTINQLESGHNVGLLHILAALNVFGKGLLIVGSRPDYDQIERIFRDDE